MCIRQELSAPTMYSAPVAIWSFTLSRPMQTDTACSSTANIPRSRSTRQYGSVQRLRYLPQDLANHATYCNKDIQLARSGIKQFAHAVTTVVYADLMRKACRQFRRFYHIVNKITEVINLSPHFGKRALLSSKYRDDSLSQKPHNWPRDRRYNRTPGTGRQNGAPT